MGAARAFVGTGFVVVLAACASDTVAPGMDAGAPPADAGASATSDAGMPDAGSAPDAAAPPRDAGTCAWTRIHTATSAEPLGVAQALLDPMRRRMIVLGDAIWSIDLARPQSGWQRSPAPAPALPGYSAVLDRTRDRVILFGGCDGQGAFTAALTGVAPAPLASPAARCGHTAVIDTGVDRMIIFGGTGMAGALGDVHALDLTGAPVWRELRTAGAAPGPRTGATAAYDLEGRRMIVFGGRSGNAGLSDVWALSLAAAPSWSQLTPAGSPPPGALRLARGAYDAAGKRLVFYAGATSRGIDGTVWSLTLGAAPVWNGVLLSPHPPSSADDDFPVIVDAAGARIVVFAKTPSPELWALPLACF